MKLRPYQAQMVGSVYRAIAEGHNSIAIVASTGSGKTVISAKICSDAVRLGKRCLFLVHMDVLVGQTAVKMQDLPLGFIKAGWEEDRSALMQLASIQTMALRDWWLGLDPDVIIYDEAHIVLTSQIGQQVFEAFPNAIHLPMTATPKRMRNPQIGDFVSTVVASPTPRELQQQGFLAPLKYFAVGEPDLSRVAIAGDDYEEEGLKNACDHPELIVKIVKEWIDKCFGLRTLAFCVDLDHARNVAAAFNEVGIPAACVEGSTPIEERKQMYAALRAEEILVLTSVNVISIGFDEPSVEVGLMLRPTASESLWFQMLGRIMRISPETGKKYGIILDQAGNSSRLGLPEEVEKYDVPVSDSNKKNGFAPTKACPLCGKLHYNFASHCMSCGFWWPSDKTIDNRDLIEVQPNVRLSGAEIYEIFCSFRRQVFLQGLPPENAVREFAERFRLAPPEEWYLGSVFGENRSNRICNAYIDYLTEIADHAGYSQEWVLAEFEKEFGVTDGIAA